MRIACVFIAGCTLSVTTTREAAKPALTAEARGCTVLLTWAAGAAQLERDGHKIQALNGAAGTYEDTPPDCGTLEAPLFTASDGLSPEHVTLTWSAPRVVPSSAYIYGLRSADGAQLTTATIELAPEVASYEVRRDGTVFATLDPSSFGVDDAQAITGTVDSAPAGLKASTDRSDGVLVEWQPSLVSPGPPHAYELIAKSGSTSVTSSDVGWRAPPHVVYEVEVDDAWTAVGSDTSWLDETAPNVQLSLPGPSGPHIALDEFRTVVTLLLRQYPPHSESATRTYRVRVAGQAPAFVSAPANGARSLRGPAQVTWQRSAGDADAAYADLADATGAAWFDDSGPGDGTAFYYRARVHGSGADDYVTAGTRARRYGASEVASSKYHACIIQRVTGKLICQGGFNNDHALEAESIPLHVPFHGLQMGSHHATALGPTGSIYTFGYLGGSIGPGGAFNPHPGPWAAAYSGGNLTCFQASVPGPISECWGEPTLAPTGTYASVHLAGGFGCGVRSADRRAECFGQGDYTQVEALGPIETMSISDDLVCAIHNETKQLACKGPDGPALPNLSEVGQAYRVATTQSSDDDPYAYADAVCIIGRSDRSARCRAVSANPITVVPYNEERYSEISLGTNHACALREVDGFVRCWGETPQFPLFHGQPKIFASLPRDDSALAAAASLSGLCTVRRADRRLLCSGGIAVGTTLPTGAFSQIAIANTFGCALTDDDGDARCFGSATNAIAATPVGANFSRLAVTDSCACGIEKSGIRCWGDSLPATFLGGVFVDLSAAPGKLCGRAANGTVACTPNASPAGLWSKFVVSSSGQCGVQLGTDALVCTNIPGAPTTGKFKDVVLSAEKGCALRQDGTPICWGGLRAPPADAYDSISVSRTRACGLRTQDQRVICGDMF